jgi:hypothetical protein
VSQCKRHPIYRICCNCGREMPADLDRECIAPDVPTLFESSGVSPDRVAALREARHLIKTHAMMTWKSGLIERSDGITDVLAAFDEKFPEGRES